MSCVQYENFQIETPYTRQEPKPFVLASRITSADPAARVAEALDLVLANGAMPA